MAKYKKTYQIEFRQVSKKPVKGQLIFGDNVPDNREIFSSFEMIPEDVGDENIKLSTDGEQSIFVSNIKSISTVKKIKSMMGRAKNWKVFVKKKWH